MSFRTAIRFRFPLLALFLAAVMISSTPLVMAQACPELAFTEAPIYAVGTDTRGIATADFNSDGRPDLAVVDINSDSVTVLRKVALGVPAVANSWSVGRVPASIVAADFNADGKPDLVTGNTHDNNISVLLNDGAGGFLPANVFDAPFPNSMTVADLNSDGKLDLAIVGSGLVVLLGNGQGAFSAPQSFTVGQQPKQVTAGDFNGDSKLDLAISIIGNVQIMIGNGAGSFTRITTPCAQTNADGLAAADLNADGKLDLVTSNTSSTSVLLGNGAGCFGTPTVLSGGSTYITLADLNADGKLDTVGGTSVRLGNGSGGFSAATVFGTSSEGTPSANTVVRDFDLDGKLDIATTGSGSASILLGDGAGGFRFAVGPNNRGAFDIARGDFNNDGKLDLALLVVEGVALKLGDGAGGFGASAVFPVGSFFLGLVVADFNHDQKADVATFDSKLNVLLGDGAGHLGAPIAADLPGNSPVALGVGDFNADGNPDVVTLNRFGAPNANGTFSVLLGDGTGHFSAPATLPVEMGGNPKKIGVADLNGDGKIDLAVPSGLGYSILLGNGSGGFGTPSYITTTDAMSVGVADFNNDNKPDLVLLSERYNNKVAVVFGNGSGGFSAPSEFGVGNISRDVTVGDFNGDGRADLAVSNGSLGPPLTRLANVSVLLGNGAGNFAPAAVFAVEWMPLSIIAGDFNADGRSDLITANANANNISVLLSTCAQTNQPPAFQFGAAIYSVNEFVGTVTVTVTRTGSTAGPATVRYATSDGTASSRSDYIASLGTLHFADGESAKSFNVFIIEDLRALENGESINLTLSDPVGATLGPSSSAVIGIFDNDDQITTANPIGNPEFFVREQYLDFLNRQPDSAGFGFWTAQITQCEPLPIPERDACREIRRINVSAAFFLSIEFQETGYLAYRTYKAAYGDATSPNVSGTVPVIRLNEFLADSQQIGQGIVVGEGDWQNQLNVNKNAYLLEFVQRQRFLNVFPLSMTAAQFVDALNQNAGAVLTQSERDQLVAQLTAAVDQNAGRAAALRSVAENSLLRQRESNRAFVLMQYYGYLRRNPDDSPDTDFRGWKFWLDKLSSFNGNFVDAEMVKAFIVSGEYRIRFNGPDGL
jgi:hypothetical protein